MERKGIVLKAKVGSNEIVRLRPKAVKLVQQLQKETGMSASAIVSEIIYQAITFDTVRVEYDVEDDDDV